MVTRVRTHTPVRVFRPGDEEPYAELSAERFAGSLVHPVPRLDMDRKFGVDWRGCKIVARWLDTEKPVQTGDLVEIEGTRHTICGVTPMPGCYVELYFKEP